VTLYILIGSLEICNMEQAGENNRWKIPIFGD